ncbi:MULTISPECIES: 4-(cytidine 5'-diphospho)-2-C-methyl-D-erythritol kinase [unclassified Campylobacter]|uniref:4-(cytidine 5'-diphospho)-2-C-methyl-D-erythritol kinase n=1 Tax=unclassified Campylobacter TaxID=2593542 RepID=UPI003D34887B
MKSYAKLNIFLKIIGTRGDYHEILSRFVRYDALFDELNFVSSDGFSIDTDSQIKDNIILKAKLELENAGFKNELNEFFKNHKIELKKRIPMGAGLGGGSSNAATFLLLANESLNLKISTQKLMQIGSKIGADVPFFISQVGAANVSGIGEVIHEIDDNVPEICIFTPEIFCSTPAVYAEFRKNFMQNINVKQARSMLDISSFDLLKNFKNYELNDLYMPCFTLYKDMQEYKDMFLSGSGSSLFFLK